MAFVPLIGEESYGTFLHIFIWETIFFSNMYWIS